jgi:hypothetical protein
MRYLAKLTYHVSGMAAHANSFEEEWRIIAAADETKARAIAEAIGIGEDTVIHRIDGSSFRWKFVAVSELICIDGIANGEIIFTQTRQEPPTYADYLQARMRPHLSEPAAAFEHG